MVGALTLTHPTGLSRVYNMYDGRSLFGDVRFARDIPERRVRYAYPPYAQINVSVAPAGALRLPALRAG